MEQGRASLSARLYHHYPTSSRLSSVKLIATIADEKQNSLLNRAIGAVRDYPLMHDSHTR
jgi:hypothetical protein